MTKRKIFKLVYVILALVIISLLLFNDDGVVKYFALKKELKDLDDTIDSSKIKIEKLSAEIDSLKNINAKIEQVARDKYRMKNVDEIPIRINKQ